MKKLITLISIAISAVIFNSCGSVKETTPTYKFFAKVNGTEWKTNEVLPSTIPTSAVYINYLNYYSNTINIEIRNPNTGEILDMFIYNVTPSNGVGTYNSSDAKFSGNYYLNNSDANYDKSQSGSFKITSLTVNASTGNISNFSGTFNFSQTSTHTWDKVTRTTNITEGQINNISE
ncbi:MAG: hypothetical protein U0V72_00450 [Cytophagales bacterium]